MRIFRLSSSLSFVLRGLLVLALLAIAPLYEIAHAMTVASTHDAMSDMTAHDMTDASMPHQMPASHVNHDAACRILCFGWVEAIAPERHEGQITEIAEVLTPAEAPLLAGFEPAPSRHPPKPASFA